MATASAADRHRVDFVGGVVRMEMMGFSDFIWRMQVEQKELMERLEKLQAFMRSDKYEAMTEQERCLLDGQFHHMSEYHGFLNTSIDFYRDRWCK